MRCPGCFSLEVNENCCPKCGYDVGLRRSSLLLPHWTRLRNDRYLIGRLIGRLGGFGVTYLAYDQLLETVVAVKEYLPRDIAGRSSDRLSVTAHSESDTPYFEYGLQRFLDEARTLAKIDHPNVVRVRDFFEENRTAYLVMDYCDGLTLSEYIKRQPTGKVSEEQAVAIMMPILDGLKEVHKKGFLHRDMKPANIYLASGGRPIILDFGAARQSMGEKSNSMSVVLSEGFAPIEQYQRNGKQGPWTDVYGTAATLYTMLTGSIPPPATERINKDTVLPGLQSCSAKLRNVVEQGMALLHSKRIQDMAQFQIALGSRQEMHLDQASERKSFSSEPIAPKKPARPMASRLPISPDPINTQSNWIDQFLAPSYLVPLAVSVSVVLVAKLLLSDHNDQRKHENTGTGLVDSKVIRHESKPAIREKTINRNGNPDGNSDHNSRSDGRSDQQSTQDPHAQAEIKKAEDLREAMHSNRGRSWSVEKYKEALSAFRAAQIAESEYADRWKKEIGFANKKIEALQQASRGASSGSHGTAQEEMDPRVLRWAARNPWFGNDKAMTDFAVQKGHELSGDGYEPGSDAFFRNIDLAVREAFPSHFPKNNEPPTIDPKAAQWSARNPWFGQRKDMTDYAMSIHRKLIQRGVDPESDEYYRIIDASIRKRFPSYFN